MDRSEPKLALDYPCRWEYRVIGADPARVRRAIGEVVGELEHTVRARRLSRAGRYCSLSLELVVDSEARRVAIYRALSAHRDIKIVL